MAEQVKEEQADHPPLANGSSDGLEQTTSVGAGERSSGSDEQSGGKPAPPAQPEQKKDGPAKPSKLKALWAKTGLDFMTLSMMFKGSLPPTIAIAMYQSAGVAEVYQTLGYLVAISSILGFCIMPRGKFIQHMALNVLAICFAAAINLLALYCVVQARIHTTPTGQPPTGYNSSASAVCAIWLMVQIYFINVVRAARPQFQFQAILCSIFVVVAMTYGTQFPTMSYAMSFMKRLLLAFLTGFALATGTSFLVFPTSSRLVVFKELTGYLQLLNGTLKTQTAYMASLETFDPLEQKNASADNAESNGKKSKAKKGKTPPSDDIWATPASAKVRELMGKLVELHTKLHGDITPAKREIAIGKLESHDLTEIWKLTRAIFLPVMGLSAMISILERSADLLGWKQDREPTKAEAVARHRQVEHIHESMRFLHKPFAQMTGVLDGAFQHILITLELVKPPKEKQPDEESRGDGPPAPGTLGFAEAYKVKVDEFYNSKRQSLEEWCSENGIKLPADFFDTSFVHHYEPTQEEEHRHETHQRQLFFVLYLEYLLWRVARAVLDLVIYVDKRKQEGAFKRSKVIFPGSKTIYRWIASTWGQEDMSHEDSFTTDMDQGGAESLYLGQGFDKKLKDPEHEPPRNTLEKIGERIRYIPYFFRSDSSAFGFRVVAATMTLGIVCYLESTQLFFLENRLLWAEIMVAMSMNRTSGQSTFQFVLRVLGTAIAMVGAYIIWYIVDGKTAGAIVFLWLWMMLAFYPILKMPKFIIVAILSIVTSVLIVGYELQVREIGTKAATSNGQPAYPTYILAPYRLATVAGGILIAFIWTIFPFPISESTELRKDLAASLNLMSAYYENAHETVQARVGARAGNKNKKGTHAYNLEKARMTIFSKLIFVLETLKTNAAFSKFQIRVGGRFPHEQYDELINCMRRLLLWVSLASYASVDFDQPTDGGSGDANRSLWADEFRKVIANADTTSHRIASLLSLLASSLSNGRPLPPYLELPPVYQFVKKLNHIDKDIMSIRHIAEPEYSAFAVLQVATQCINTDIRKLTEHVKNLVGEIDFSYRAVKASSASSYLSTDDSEDDEKGKAD